MENKSSSKWVDLDLHTLMKKDAELNLIARYRPTYDNLLKLGIHGRQLKIASRDVWQQMIEKDGYLVRYHNGNGKEVNFDDQNAQHFTLKEYP